MRYTPEDFAFMADLVLSQEEENHGTFAEPKHRYLLAYLEMLLERGKATIQGSAERSGVTLGTASSWHTRDKRVRDFTDRTTNIVQRVYSGDYEFA